MRRLKVAALLAGEPGPRELWTLRLIASTGCELGAVQAMPGTAAPPLERARALFKKHGPGSALCRLVRDAAASRAGARDRKIIDELFDFDDLRAWWTGSGVAPIRVRSLSHAQTRATLSTMAPDVIVQLSGGALKTRIAARARLAALKLRCGRTGSAVCLAGRGREAGPPLWRGAPQLAPGDTRADLSFRAHLEASAALARIVADYGRGERDGC